jgi:hypothetical protein
MKPRMLSVSVREGRMFVDRILLTCGLPSGYVHGVRECVLLSQALGLGGLQHLLDGHGALEMAKLGALRVEERGEGLTVDGGGIHAWLLLPTLTDLAVDLARKSGRATVQIVNLAAIAELRIAEALAKRYGAAAYVTLAQGGKGALLTMSNGSQPRSFEQRDPVMHAAMRDGFAVDEVLWRAIHALSNEALAPDSVVSRRHAGPVILQDDGTILGRKPQDDDFDLDMLKKVTPRG